MSARKIVVPVALRAPEWRRALDDPRALARRAVRTALREAGTGLPPGGAEISVVFADDAFVRELNRVHRGRDRATNVLSFPAYEDLGAAAATLPPGEPAPLGDVVLAHETVVREAAAAGKPVADHATHLLIHGTLHLVGHDHEEAGEAAVMEALEVAALARLGIADPYRAPATA